jgi:molybdate transport system regulatory protein
MPRPKSTARSKPAFSPRDKDTDPSDAQAPGPRGYALKSRLWIGSGEETYLAWGRVILLERIRDGGSISQAARSMGISYRHAWKLVDSMNRLAPDPLVVKATGGKGGGGATLTPRGERAIEEFWKLQERLAQFLRTQEKRLEHLLK